MKYLIAGLGNIGSEYELTRHNIGFLILDRLADLHKAEFDLERLAEKAEFKYKGKHIHLIKPTTYMNLSGKAVAYWLNHLKIAPEQLLIVVDDVAIPFGSLRLRPKGSSAGHNGLKNIEEVLGHQNYARLRFGDKACEMILSFCTIGTERTMSIYND
jgi:PTH1 family peptidyl-tRNA hydrolase